MNVNMIFGIIFAAIVIGFAVVLGGSQIAGLFGVSGLSQLEQAVANLDNQVDITYNYGRGSIIDFPVSIPGDAKLCIIDPANPGKNIFEGWNPDFTTQYYLENPGNQYYGANVWYFQGTEFNSRNIPKLRTSVNFCVSGSETLLLENQGTYVSIARE